ncbi:uncharacterized protein MYCFIDRAFT_84224 [Pseudocercospora fijiensis CIRAD86]|uniref:Uncharacterized protein n=1 Tax=Pseudocercospora fijiensis (strain CIRAD86) TaxID=383855 RepID=N1Q8D5_PSEFD|nr:uncharacterized protein MYCFIDRAFT_84224 [Pseudocercospora fijiensis CIRAD86]EME87182.1 hypothetical protein MYCFIDRAFT_84224 [Pseudocercospora fijiensis CIRAD86]
MQLFKKAKLVFLTLAVSAGASQVLVNNYCLEKHWITEINGTWNSNGTWALNSGVAYITEIVGKGSTPKLILGYSTVDGELWWSVSSYDGQPYPPKHFNVTSPNDDSENSCGEAVGYEAKNHNCKDGKVTLTLNLCAETG